MLPPLSLDGPSLTIRKFAARPFRVDDMVRLRTLTPRLAELLSVCVLGKLNILVSGGTGTGKTTLLNVLSSFIPDDERIITIEDAAELQLARDNIVRLEARPPNLEDKGEVTIRDLVRNSLRMEGNVIGLQDIFTLHHGGELGDDGLLHGTLQPTGIRPAFADHLKANGFTVPARLLGGGDPIRELKRR